MNETPKYFEKARRAYSLLSVHQVPRHADKDGSTQTDTSIVFMFYTFCKVTLLNLFLYLRKLHGGCVSECYIRMYVYCTRFLIRVFPFFVFLLFLFFKEAL